ncbi:MAG: hypothetical protein KJN60_12580 [Boseongicola sp.]|nr:hypothetical protein [Boseongicola sp.]
MKQECQNCLHYTHTPDAEGCGDCAMGTVRVEGSLELHVIITDDYSCDRFEPDGKGDRVGRDPT